jgi:hypothetical protein
VSGLLTALRLHVIAIGAALFALAIGIALGGGPLSYVSDDDPVSAVDQPEPDDEEPSQTPTGSAEPASSGFADAFAAAAAPRLYDKALFGHPTVIIAMPGVDAARQDAMVAQVAQAGGGLTGVFALTDTAVDRDETSLVDSLGSQLMTQLADERVDPAASTYARLGQLLGIAVSTPDKDGKRSDAPAATVRASLSTGGLLTGPGQARLAPLVLVLLPPHSEEEPEGPEDPVAQAAIYQGLTTGLRANAAGVVLVGDTASGEEGLLAELRRDEPLTSTIATVDGGETVLGQVTAMLALIDSLKGSVGAYGASGSDGAVPIS